MKNTLEYCSNNSGGSWWLTDDDWHKLEAEGWTVDWVKDETDGPFAFMTSTDGRWLGALAKAARKEGTDPEALIAEWERITGQDSTAEGCSCCGEPHDFTWYDADGKGHWASVHVTSTVRSWS